MSSQLWWYTARASGLVAWALVNASVIWGLALSTKVLGRRPRPSWMLDLHRFLGGAAVVFVGVHVGGILLDSYTHFGLVDVLVPLTATWHPAAVAWGIVGMYLLLAVEITSLLRRHLSKRSWHLVHLLSFPLAVISTIHLLTAGTDGANPVLGAAVLLVAATVGGLGGYRFFGGRTLRAPSTPRQPSPPPPPPPDPPGSAWLPGSTASATSTAAAPWATAPAGSTALLDGHPAPALHQHGGVTGPWPPPDTHWREAPVTPPLASAHAVTRSSTPRRR